MSSHPALYRFAHVSPLALDDGLLSGWALHPEHDTVQVELFIDDARTEIASTGTVLPARLHERTGSPASARSGFVFPLPAFVFDGNPHVLCVKLIDPAALAEPAAARPPAAACPTPRHLAEASLRFRHGPVSGQVMLEQGRLRGEVRFRTTPDAVPELTIVATDGRPIDTLTLTPTLCPPGSPARYVASFDHTLADEHGEARLYCMGVELVGSPVVRTQKRVGVLEPVNQQHIHGWAMDLLQPRRVLELALVVDGQRVTRFRPNVRRDDIAAYMKRPIEDFGIIGYNFDTPPCLLDGREHSVRVEFVDDGTPLHGSPQKIRFPAAWIDLDRFRARLGALAQPAPGPAEAPPTAPAVLARPATPSLSIVVLNRNGAALLEALFDSFHRINTLGEVEWILIDHASTDNSREVIARWQQILPIHLEALDYNDSFSASCNRGATLARADTLLFLNNDIVWLQDILPPLLHQLVTTPDIAALGVKLLKAAEDSTPLAQPEVQHLGIRFTLSGSAYWPYEATPAPERNEREYGPQQVAGVTGAALLCRRADFDAAGRFRTEYFYGFEDVELCLRLQQRLGKRIVCRNDLVALHRHGHSRLSGRQQDIFSRLLTNSDILQDQVGLWLKFAYWRSLLSGDGLLANEPLHIGIALTDCPDQSRAALELAERITAACPAARPVFLTPDQGWFNLRDLHLLVVADPRFDLRQRRYQRNDLLIAAWVQGAPAPWLDQPWHDRYDLWLCDTRKQRKALEARIGRPLHPTTVTSLGRLLDPQAQALRIALLTPTGERSARQTADARRSLAATLQQAGALVWEEPDTAPALERMAHIRIQVCAGKALTRPKAKAAPDCVNLVWALAYDPNTPAPRGPQGWTVCTTPPTLAQLRHAVETRVAHTFHTP